MANGKDILKFILFNRRFTVQELVNYTGLSMTTIGKYIDELRDDGIVEDIECLATGNKGRRPILYGIKNDSHYFVGVDVKHFEFGIGVMDLGRNMPRAERDRSFKLTNTHSTLDDICSRVQDFISRLEPEIRKRIAAVNFNIGGRVDSRNGISSSFFNFEEMQGSSLADMLNDRLGIPVFLENDTKSMAFGEFQAFGNSEWQNVLYINVGWGLGLGIITGGNMYYGKDGYSGEFGHVPSYDNNVLCHCGKKGCLETEVSIAAIHRKLTRRILDGEASVLSAKVHEGQTITVDDIIEATNKEDPLCIELVSWTGSELGRKLAGIINIFNPDAIIIGGSLAKVNPYYFLQPAILAVRKYALKLMCNNVPIVTSKLGDDAGLTGACTIAMSRYFSLNP